MAGTVAKGRLRFAHAGARKMVSAFSATPLPWADAETLLAASITVPARIRASRAPREIDCDDVLEVPLLASGCISAGPGPLCCSG